MTEEEIIKVLNYQLNMKGTDVYTPINYDAIQGLLDIYNKQKEELERLKNAEEYSKLGKETLLDTIHKQEKEIEELKKPKYIMNFETGSVTKIDNDFISKDKALKALGYEENSEAYNRMDSEEKVISLIRLVNAECNRLEDIEDKKVEVAVNFIEEKRDKYWQKKIRDKIKELEKEKEKYKGDKGLRYSQVGFIQSGINVLNKLLEEK